LRARWKVVARERVEMRGHGCRSSSEQHCTEFSFVTPGLDPGIHVFVAVAY
jgi:hypothetical protein